MVRIFVSSRRPCDSDALATSSYGMNFAQPLSAATLVSAAVKVVLPWSMCPIVPTFTCGLLRSNFSFAISPQPFADDCGLRVLIKFRELLPRLRRHFFQLGQIHLAYLALVGDGELGPQLARALA